MRMRSTSGHGLGVALLVTAACADDVTNAATAAEGDESTSADTTSSPGRDSAATSSTTTATSSTTAAPGSDGTTDPVTAADDGTSTSPATSVDDTTEASSGDPPGGGSTSADGASTGGSDETTAGVGSQAESSSTGATEDASTTAEGPSLPFVEVAQAAGFDHALDVMAPAPNCLIDATDPAVPGLFCSPERYAGGVAIVDIDDDGDLDAFITRPYSEDLLYLNDGAGNFEDAAAQFGIVDTLGTSGVAFGDIDNDGDQDLYITTLGELRHYLFVNEGGVFVEDGVSRGAAILTEYQHAGSTPTFADYDLDGDLDLYVGEWRTYALGSHQSHARLLRNLGPQAPGFFEDVTLAAGLDIDLVHEQVGGNIQGTFVLSAGWADMDADGYPDLLLACDFATSRLFWNNGDGTFLDGTTAAGVGTDENGMGASVADYDADGDLDWFVTSILGETKTGNRLYQYVGGREFVDATDAAGVRDDQWGWGTAFFDHDLDTDLDLVATNGWYATLYLEDPMFAWTNDGTGVFTPAANELGFDDDGQGRALVTFDADGDGDLEVLLVNNGGEVKLYRNDTPREDKHWLRVRTPGTASNSDGIGAIVTVDTSAGPRVAEVGGTSHYLGHGPREAHFGLGTDELVDVHVTWPATGQTEDLIDVAADQVLVVPEP